MTTESTPPPPSGSVPELVSVFYQQVVPMHYIRSLIDTADDREALLTCDGIGKKAKEQALDRIIATHVANATKPSP